MPLTVLEPMTFPKAGTRLVEGRVANDTWHNRHKSCRARHGVGAADQSMSGSKSGPQPAAIKPCRSLPTRDR